MEVSTAAKTVDVAPNVNRFLMSAVVVHLVGFGCFFVRGSGPNVSVAPARGDVSLSRFCGRVVRVCPGLLVNEI